MTVADGSQCAVKQLVSHGGLKRNGGKRIGSTGQLVVRLTGGHRKTNSLANVGSSLDKLGLTSFYWAMATHPVTYQRSDAWVLLSIIYTSRETPATIGNIIMAGDHINHCNFTSEELNTGIFRLKEGQWITESPDGFLASEKVLKAYQAMPSGLSSREALKKIEKLLSV